jgi:hypothetical protein
MMSSAAGPQHARRTRHHLSILPVMQRGAALTSALALSSAGCSRSASAVPAFVYNRALIMLRSSPSNSRARLRTNARDGRGMGMSSRLAAIEIFA